MKKMLALTLLLVLIAAMVSGCTLFGKAKEADEFSGIMDEIAENEDEKIFDEQVYAFEDAADLLNTFKEFGYEWFDAEGAVEWSVEWETLGKEAVDGVQATYVRCIKFDYDETEEYELWFNDEWLAVKAVVDGEDKEGWEAEGAGYMVTMTAQTYVTYANLVNIIFADSNNPGTLDGSAYKLESKTRESISIGGSSSVDLYRVKSLWANSYWELGLTKVGAKNLYVILKQGVADTSEGLRVTSAVAR